jgi:glycosyltransferase involved in cell wall biosynthesis
MKIAWCLDQVILCGGVKIPFGYCRELQKLGIDSKIYANGSNIELESYYGVEVRPLSELNKFTDTDIIIAVWWRQVPELGKYKGRKIQFVQGNDLESYVGTDLKQECINTRNMVKWDLMAVSNYAGKWTNRPYTVIPNAIDDIFFEDLGLIKDIDALVEGNDEPNKNIDYAIQKAKEDGHKKIVWLNREHYHAFEGVDMITNPPQKDIPSIYQRAKHFYKYSKSEGFCLPIVEAKASGCIIHTHDMGHNFPEDFNPKDYNWNNSVNTLLKYINANT